MGKRQFRDLGKGQISKYKWIEKLERFGLTLIEAKIRRRQKRFKGDPIIIKSPGHSYMLFAKIMEPSITMMQEEYFDYLQEGNTTFALLVKIRFAFIFFLILGLNFPLIKKILDITEKIAK